MHASSTDPPDFVTRCRELARSRPASVALRWLRDGDEEQARLTYAELDARARALGVELERRGLEGGRALLAYPPGLEFVVGFLGCLYARVIAVPVQLGRMPRAARATRRIAARSAPAIVLTERALRGPASHLVEGLGAVELLCTDDLDPARGSGWRPGPIQPESIAFLQYTSGSTAAPRGVEVSHANLVQNQRMIRAGFANDERTIFVGWLPLFHDMGLVGNVLQPLFLGGQAVLMAPSAFVQRPVRWLRAISRFRGTVAGSPDFGYAMCVERVSEADLATLDLSSWRVAYDGSEPVRAETLERFARRFAPAGFRREALYPCYGMAEATLFVTGGRAGEPYSVHAVDEASLGHHRVRPATTVARAVRLVSCGRPWLDQRVCIVDPVRRIPAAPDAVGEIWIQGSNVARGYRDLPALEENPFRARLASGEGPFLRTGDLGYLHEGQLYVTGRLKDVLILRGVNHYPQDLEHTASRAHPALSPGLAAAFTEGEGERLALVLEVARTSVTGLAGDGVAQVHARREVIDAVRAALVREHGLGAARIVLVEPGSIPRTTSGKVQRRLCRTRLREGGLCTIGVETARHPSTRTTT